MHVPAEGEKAVSDTLPHINGHMIGREHTIACKGDTPQNGRDDLWSEYDDKCGGEGMAENIEAV